MKLSNFPRLLACPFLRSFSANAIAPKQDNSCPRITGNNNICLRFEIILMVHSTTFLSLLALFAAHFFQLLCKYNCTVRSDDSCPKLFFSKEKRKYIYILRYLLLLAFFPDSISRTSLFVWEATEVSHPSLTAEISF